MFSQINSYMVYYEVPNLIVSFAPRDLKETMHIPSTHMETYTSYFTVKHLAFSAKVYILVCLETVINSSKLHKYLFIASGLLGAEPDRYSGIRKILGCG